MGKLIHEIGFLFNVKFIISTKYAFIQPHLEYQPYKALTHKTAYSLYITMYYYALAADRHHLNSLTVADIMMLAKNWDKFIRLVDLAEITDTDFRT